MQFTSYVFVAFFLIVYGTYLLLQNRYRSQNKLLLVASYVFYGWWDWRFCSLLVLSTVVDFFVGRAIGQSEDPKQRKRLVTASLLVNLGVLGFFKYFDFFISSTTDMLNSLGVGVDPFLLSVVLPMGISFYTFQTLSYTIDVYRGRMKPVGDIWDFGLYVSFFPQLVAGPIERATHLLPQICGRRTVTTDQVHAGLFLILWGFFKKLVIADNVALIANSVFNGYTDHGGLGLLVGTLAFAFQIYCDFSAYSDIARGTSKLMGFDLMVNFRLPYFAISPSDFWRRWHISLSSWLRDYLYISLGGNRGTKWFVYRNLMITMLLGGLWHGASWNFVLWGLFHGLILVAYRIVHPGGHGDTPAHTLTQKASWLGQMAVMFVLTLIGWVLFRATGVVENGQVVHTSMEQIGYFFTHAFAGDGVPVGGLYYELAWYVLPLFVIQVWQQRAGDLLVMTKLPMLPRAVFYGWLMTWIVLFGARETAEFIYFQF